MKKKFPQFSSSSTVVDVPGIYSGPQEGEGLYHKGGASRKRGGALYLYRFILCSTDLSESCVCVCACACDDGFFTVLAPVNQLMSPEMFICILSRNVFFY